MSIGIPQGTQPSARRRELIRTGGAVQPQDRALRALIELLPRPRARARLPNAAGVGAAAAQHAGQKPLRGRAHDQLADQRPPQQAHRAACHWKPPSSGNALTSASRSTQLGARSASDRPDRGPPVVADQRHALDLELEQKTFDEAASARRSCSRGVRPCPSAQSRAGPGATPAGALHERLPVIRAGRGAVEVQRRCDVARDWRAAVEDRRPGDFDRVLVHRPSEDNVAADELAPRACSSAASKRSAIVCGCVRHPGPQPHGHPIAELILTVLSQSTNDRNRDVAYLALESGSRPGSRSATRPSTSSRKRSGRAGSRRSSRRGSSRSCRQSPKPRPGRRAVTRLAAERVGARRTGVSDHLPGVGRKTAACVLLFALGMRDVPVDTHVSRVGSRLGLFRPGRRSRSCTTRCSS